MASIQDLPDEIILKVINYLEIEDLTRCGRVSKRIRKISHDESLRKKLIFAIKYLWADNEAAKKSSDMRIEREKVILEEMVRLDNMIKDLKNDNDSYSNENKELCLKLRVILDENARLGNILRDMDRN